MNLKRWLYLVLLAPTGWAFFGGFFPLLVLLLVESKNRNNPSVKLDDAIVALFVAWPVCWLLWLFCRWAGPLGLILPTLIREARLV